MLFSRTYLIAVILPSIPLVPNPGAIRIPSNPFKVSATFSSVISSDWTVIRLTFASLAAPACMNDSMIDL